jgi:hypothetical protein
MGNRDAALKQYYRSIRSELPCNWGQRNRILRQIRESVDNYLEENPDADFAAIEAHFGNAQTIASSYIDVQDAPELLRKMRIKKRVTAIIVGAVAVVLLIWGAAVVWAMIDVGDSNDGGIEVIVGEK